MRAPVLPPDLIAPLVGYLVVANVAALAMFAFRRAASRDGQWSDYETRTLFLAVMGGWPGAMLGRLLFRPKREMPGFGLILDLSVFALPVVLTVPFLLRAVPGWVPQGEADRPTQIADTTSDTSPGGVSGGVVATIDVGQATTPVGAALLASETPAGTFAGIPLQNEIASTVPPPRPDGLVDTGAPAPSAITTASTPTSGSSATTSTSTATGGTTTATSTTTATAQSPTTSTSRPRLRHRLRARTLNKN